MLLLTFQGCAGNLKVSGGVLQVSLGPLSTTWLRSSLGANEEQVSAALIPGKPVDPTAGGQMITAAGRHTGMVLWRSPNLLVLLLPVDWEDDITYTWSWQPFVCRVPPATRAARPVPRRLATASRLFALSFDVFCFSGSTDAFEALLKREYLSPSGTQQTSQTDRPFHTPAHSLVGPA